MNATPATRYCTKCGQPAQKTQVNKYVCDNGHANWLDAVPGATVYVLHATEAKVLFGIRSIDFNAGKLNVVGGFLDIGETAEQAAVREAREEMGVEIELLDILRTYTSGYDDHWVLNVTFVARHIGGEPVPADDMNGGAPRWIAIDQLPALDELAWPWQYEAQRDLQLWYQRHLHRQA